jgi:Flp pilus assembly protein TadG
MYLFFIDISYLIGLENQSNLLLNQKILGNDLGRAKKIARKRILEQKNSGSVLVEFVASIPVLILIIYVLLDLSKYYLMRFKLENASRYAANLLIRSITVDGNVAYIDAQDFKYIAHAAFCNIYVGNQNLVVTPQKHNSVLSFHFVSSEIGAIQLDENAVISAKVSGVPGDSSGQEMPSDANEFNVQPGEKKIILEVGIIGPDSTNLKKMLGFFLLPVAGVNPFLGKTIALDTTYDAVAIKESQSLPI